MTTLAERILVSLRSAGVDLDDDELAARLGVVRQAINQAARRLEAQKQLTRYVGSSGKLVNRLAAGGTPDRLPVQQLAPAPRSSGHLTEDEVKQAVKSYLEARGYEVSVAWGRARGVDIDARCATGRILIEAKGAVSLQPQQVNYFLGALGELVQRMSDDTATYALALPDNSQYRGLVSRLPPLARERLRLVVYFARRVADGFDVTEA